MEVGVWGIGNAEYLGGNVPGEGGVPGKGRGWDVLFILLRGLGFLFATEERVGAFCGGCVFGVREFWPAVEFMLWEDFFGPLSFLFSSCQRVMLW